MFTANSMNCLTEALGPVAAGQRLDPGHPRDREQLFLRAGRLAVELCRATTARRRRRLPRNIASFKAFENAMTWTSPWAARPTPSCTCWPPPRRRRPPSTCATSTAVAQGAAVLCKVAPNIQKYHMEDVHRAGGIFSILGELPAAACCTTCRPSTARSMAEAIAQWDITQTNDEAVHTSSRPARPASRPRWRSARAPLRPWTTTAKTAASARVEHAFAGGRPGRAHQQHRPNGCVVKTAGVDESILCSKAPAIFESQDEAVKGILADEGQAGDVVIIRYEGPKGGPPACRRCSTDLYIKVKGLAKACALLTDGASPAAPRTVHRPRSPEATCRRAIGLVRNGDRIRIDIPNRTINVLVIDENWRAGATAAGPGLEAAQPRPRKVSTALKAYALVITSADTGAIARPCRCWIDRACPG